VRVRPASAPAELLVAFVVDEPERRLREEERQDADADDGVEADARVVELVGG
jgi:hypothetical protein